jgi:PAS domain S-box-containing protein
MVDMDQSIQKDMMGNNLEHILNDVEAIIFLYDLNDHFIFVNTAFAESIDKKVGDIIGKSVFELFPQDHAEKYSRNNRMVIETGSPSLDIQEKMFTKKGIRWVKTNKKPFYDDRGTLLGILGVTTDITDQKKAEEKLEKSEKQLELKLNSLLSPECTIDEVDFSNIINSKEIQLMMNDFYQLTNIGMAITDMKGNILVATGWQDICTKFHRIHPQTNKNCIESDIYLSEHVKPGEYVEYKCKNNLWDIATPIIISGKRLGTLFLGQFFYTDEEVDYQFFERQAEKYGFDKKQYLSALDRVPRWDRERVACVMDFYSKLSVMISQLSYSNLKLAKMVQQQKKTETELNEANHKLKNMNDILERTVEERTSELTRALKHKDEFIHQLGHDLKNPLSPIIHLLPVLEKKIPDEDVKEIYEVISRNAIYMKNLVKKTLNLANLNSSHTIFTFDTITLHESVDDVIQKNSLSFSEKNLNIINNVSNDILVNADKLRLDELLTNLFDNAIKYSGEGSTVTVHALQKETSITVCVQDNGKGISKDQIPHLFEEFYKADFSRHDFDSNGLGLPICKRIVEKHGGRIWAESDGIGKGTRFFFTLKKSGNHHQQEKM